jgi:hypothetical protein
VGEGDPEVSESRWRRPDLECQELHSEQEVKPPDCSQLARATSPLVQILTAPDRQSQYLIEGFPERRIEWDSLEFMKVWYKSLGESGCFSAFNTTP